MKVLSFGGGVQTVTIVAMCINGDFPTEFEDACQFDEAIRTNASRKIKSSIFLLAFRSNSCILKEYSN